MKVLCLGHAAYDITIPVPEFPIENTKNRVNNRVECGGGPASNAAYLLGKWGVDVWFAGIVGDDEYGKTIKEEFKSVKVNTKFLELSKHYKTTSSFIITNLKNGSRTILTYREKTMNLTTLKLDFKPEAILIDGQEFEKSIEILNKYPDAISIIDAGRKTDEIVELSKLVDYIVCSKEFAEDVTGIKINFDDKKTLIDLYKNMKKEFKGKIIVTLESHGSLYEKDNEIKLMPSIKVKQVDSTGAGDIFHGAFVYGIAQGFDIEKNLRISSITAGLSVTRIGGRNSVFTKEEVKKIYGPF